MKFPFDEWRFNKKLVAKTNCEINHRYEIEIISILYRCLRLRVHLHRVMKLLISLITSFAYKSYMIILYDNQYV